MTSISQVVSLQVDARCEEFVIEPAIGDCGEVRVTDYLRSPPGEPEALATE